MGIRDWFGGSKSPIVRAIEKRDKEISKITHILMDDITKVHVFQDYLLKSTKGKGTWSRTDKANFQKNFFKPLKRSIPLCELASKNKWVKYRTSGIWAMNDARNLERQIDGMATDERIQRVEALKRILVATYNELIDPNSKVISQEQNKAQEIENIQKAAQRRIDAPKLRGEAEQFRNGVEPGNVRVIRTPIARTPEIKQTTKQTPYTPQLRKLWFEQQAFLESNLRQVRECIAQVGLFRRTAPQSDVTVGYELKQFRKHVLSRFHDLTFQLHGQIRKYNLPIELTGPYSFEKVNGTETIINQYLLTCKPYLDQKFSQVPAILPSINLYTNTILTILREYERAIKVQLDTSIEQAQRSAAEQAQQRATG